MTASASPSTDLVHLVGSVPLSASEDVFRQVSAALAGHLTRIPDGETGKRARWVGFQRQLLQKLPELEVDASVPPLRFVQWDGKLLLEIPLLRFKAGVDPDQVAFDTGYGPEALGSYAIFRRLRAEGAIPAGVRFQVCLPTPMASAYMYVSPNAHAAFLPFYEKALRRSIDQIIAAVPPQDLSIQFDVCQEVLVFEDYYPRRPVDYKAQIFAELGRLGDMVPDQVEMGFHFCYGSPFDEHLVQPKDMGILVELMNGTGAAVRRRLDFLHVPVPKDRSDDGYFAALRSWQQRPETRLYLGLIHHADQDGDRRRIAAAKRHVAVFGVASECGWGRGDPTRLGSLLESHRIAAEAIAAA
jgi:hypothetical protein